MEMNIVRMAWAFSIALAGLPAAFAQAADIGQVKVAKGTVSIERSGQSLAAPPGTRLQTSDVVRTGNDGSVGITMTDNSLLSAGPNSVLALDRYEFDSTTNAGRFDASLQDVYATLFCTASPIPVKAALNMLGHDVGGLRLPLVEASDDERAMIQAVLERHGLLSGARAG